MTVITLPVVALANVPMALVYGIERYIYIPIVLIVEWLVLRFFFGFSWGKAATASITVNAITYVIGIFAFPFLGLVVYRTALIDLIGNNIIQGSLGELLLIMFVAAVVDAAIELSVLKVGFKCLLDKRRVIAWFLANLATAFFLLLVIGVETARQVVGIEMGKEVASKTQIALQEVDCIKQEYAAEINFMTRVGEEAASNVSGNESFDSDWLNKMEVEAGSFPSILNLVPSSGIVWKHIGTSPRWYEVFGIGFEEKPLGEYQENNLSFQKVEYGDSLTIYKLVLKSQVGEGYKVIAIVEADPTCLYPGTK